MRFVLTVLLSVLYFAVASRSYAQRAANVDVCQHKGNPPPDLIIEACTTLIQSAKGNLKLLAAWYSNRAEALRGKQDLDKALADYDEAIHVDPNYPNAYEGRADVYVDKDHYDLAYADLKKAQSLRPGQFVSFDRLCVGARPDPDGIVYCNEVVRLSPHDPMRLSERANWYCLHNDYSHCIEDLTTALKLATGPPPLEERWRVTLLIKKANAFQAIGDADHAMVDINEALKSEPDLSGGLRTRGELFLARKDYDRAIADFTRALAIDPKFWPAYNDRAVAFLNKADYDHALEDSTKAIETNSSYAQAWNIRCWIRTVTDKLEQALSDCNEALRLEPAYVAALDSRGLLNIKLGHLDAAIADYDAALKINPKFASSLYGRGVAKNKKQAGAGNVDLAAATAISADIDKDYAGYGVK